MHSPVDSIPPELLSQIFRETQSSDSTELVSISPNTGALLVSQVSSRWRHIAISDSTLWAAFKIDISPMKPSIRSSIVQLWLDRSSRQPLSITVWMDPFSHLQLETRTMVRDIFHSLASASHRWKSLSLSLPHSNELFSALCTSNAPILESLSLKLGSWTPEEASTINNLIVRSPAVKALSWSNRSSWGSWDDPFDSGMEHLQISWHGLTDVILDTWMTLKSVLNILSQCESIVNLDLRHFSYIPDLFEPTPTYIETFPTIDLPNLESLTIYQLKLDEGLQRLIDQLKSPKLKGFNYTCGFIEHYSWPQPSFHNFIVRSQCRLQSLVLEYTGISEPQLLQCLEDTTSSLTQLEVYDARGDICVTGRLLDRLRVRSDTFTGVLCPNLQILILHQVICCIDGALAATLQSRTAPSSTSTDVTHAEPLICLPLRLAHAQFSKRFHKTNEIDIKYLEHMNSDDR